MDLSTTLDQLDEEEKRADGTMLARREAIDELNSTVVWAGRSAEGLFLRAGEEELAKRVRSSTRRPPRPSVQQAADDEQQPDGESPDGESPVDEPASGSSESQASGS
ncbi:MAG: hypothetical protein GY719_27170 [bacterium]|nr:hypothetical protein [bacterium]